jgi:hypothetical protein
MEGREMSKHKITMPLSGTVNGTDWDAEYEVTFTYRKGSPATLIDPASDGEIEVVAINPSGHDHYSQAWLMDHAEYWLQDDGREAAMKIVAEDDDRAREYAQET